MSFYNNYVIVGGGISGLLMGALLSSSQNEVTLLEKNNFLGGYIHNITDEHIPYGAHHLGIPNMKFLTELCDKLDINIRGYLAEADDVAVIVAGKTYQLSLSLDRMQEQLAGYFPGEERNIRGFIEYVQGFGKALYNEASADIKNYFMHLVAMPYKKLLDRYFEDGTLKKLLCFLGPSYGGVNENASAFTFISLLSTYGNGAYYFNDYGEYFITALKDRIMSRKGNKILMNCKVTRLDREEGGENYQLFSDDRPVAEGRRVIFACYPAELLQDYCIRNKIRNHMAEKIFGLDIGPSAYRFYFQTGGELASREYIHLEDIGVGEGKNELGAFNFIISTLSRRKTNVMLTLVSEKPLEPYLQKQFLNNAAGYISDLLHIPVEQIRNTVIIDPENRQLCTANKKGAVFGYQRDTKNNMNSNLVYSIHKILPDLYIIGNWSATFGVFGTIFTVTKLYGQIGEEACLVR